MIISGNMVIYQFWNFDLIFFFLIISQNYFPISTSVSLTINPYKCFGKFLGTPDLGRNRTSAFWILAPPSDNYVIIFIAYRFLSDSKLAR